MTAEEFQEKYIDPAAKQLAKKLIEGRALTLEEVKICEACGISLQTSGLLLVEPES